MLHLPLKKQWRRFVRLAVWRTVKGTRAKSKEVVRVRSIGRAAASVGIDPVGGWH